MNKDTITSTINAELIFKKKRIKWVCQDCGQKALKKKCNQGKKQVSCSTWHTDKCDVCGEEKPVTEHRDFEYCEF